MKMLSPILLLTTVMFCLAQKPNADDVAMAITTLETYKKAIERLDTAGTGKLFLSNSIVIESGKIEGRYQDYLAHHLGPELVDFKSFTFSDYKADVTVDLPYAFATEIYKYTIVLKKDNSVIERKGAATTILKKENGTWKIWQTHTSARRP